MSVNRLTIIKLAELVLAVIVVLIHYQTMEESVGFPAFVATGTYVGFAIIIIVTFVGHMTGNGLNKTLDLIYCVAGAVLYILAAWFTYKHFSDWQFSQSHANWGMSKGVLALIQGIVLIVDGFFTFKAE